MFTGWCWGGEGGEPRRPGVRTGQCAVWRRSDQRVLDFLQPVSSNYSPALSSHSDPATALGRSSELCFKWEDPVQTYQEQEHRKIYHIDWCILNEVNVILLNPTDLNIKMERKRKIYISVLTFLAILPSYISTAHLDGEAAFQGREHGSWSILISTCVNTFLAAGQVLLFNVAFRDLLCIQRLFAETVLCLSKGSHQWFVVLETKITKFSSHF